MAAIIEVRGLTKRFGDVTALAGVDFDVHRGELFGFLGPNGAGKTTTINLLTGLARPTAGTIRIADIDCTADGKAAQRLLGVVADESNLYPELTGSENLSFCGALYGMRRRAREEQARDLLATFGLTEAADRRFGGYSKGMQRKLAIAAAIIHRPTILFLDEPTTGIDVTSARQVRALVAHLRAAGTTIFLTTHYIEEAERLCDRIAFIVSGRVVRTDTVEGLLAGAKDEQAIEVAAAGLPAGLAERLRAAMPHLTVEAAGQDRLRLTARGPIDLMSVIRFFDREGVEVTEARKMRPSLEEVFVRVTGLAAEQMKREKEKKGGGP